MLTWAKTHREGLVLVWMAHVRPTCFANKIISNTIRFKTSKQENYTMLMTGVLLL